jgi:hypothetical protein
MTGRKLLEQGGTIKVIPSEDRTVWKFCNASPTECVNISPEEIITIPSLSGLYKEIHERAPHAKIRVLLYPRLFSNNIGEKCEVKSDIPVYSVTSNVAKKLNELADTLNGIIRSEIDKAIMEVKDIDIKAIDPNNDALEGHRLCDNEPWINGLIPEGSEPSVFSFHPNEDGQRHFEEVMEESL